MILLDTSGLLAALFSDQNRHDPCARALREAEPPRILSPFVLAELDSLILKHAGVEAELVLLEEIARGVYELAPFDARDIDEARIIVEKYRDLRIGLADASLIVLANRYDVRDVLTLDERHFRAMRPAPRQRFRIFPADAHSRAPSPRLRGEGVRRTGEGLRARANPALPGKCRGSAGCPR